MIPKLSIKQKNVRAKIEKEVRILKRVNNDDNIIKLYEVFEDRNHVYLVFELLERGDLVNFFRENTLLEEDDLKKFFREIGENMANSSDWSALFAQESGDPPRYQVGQYFAGQGVEAQNLRLWDFEPCGKGTENLRHGRDSGVFGARSNQGRGQSFLQKRRVVSGSSAVLADLRNCPVQVQRHAKAVQQNHHRQVSVPVLR